MPIFVGEMDTKFGPGTMYPNFEEAMRIREKGHFPPPFEKGLCHVCKDGLYELKDEVLICNKCKDEYKVK